MYCVISTLSYIDNVAIRVITTDMSLKNQVVDLIIRSRIINGYYINTEGVQTVLSSFSYIDFIALRTDRKYHLICSMRASNSVSTISFYDSGYNLIDKIVGNYDYNGELDLSKYEQYKIILIRLCTTTSLIRDVQLTTSTDNNLPATVDILGYYNSRLGDLDNKINLGKLEVASTLIKGSYISKLGLFSEHNIMTRTALVPIVTTGNIHIKGHFSGAGVSYISIFSPDLKFIKDISGVTNNDGLIDNDFALTEFKYPYVFICLSTVEGFESTLEFKINNSSLALANENLASLESKFELRKKRFLVLTKFLDIAQGLSPYLYFDNFGNIDKGHDMAINAGSPTWFDRGIIVNSNSNNISAYIYDWNQSLIEYKLSTIRSVNRGGGDGSTKNILIVGDSLIAPCSSAKYVYDKLKEDADYNIIDCGTVGTSGAHTEGYGGWRWIDFLQEKAGTVKNNFFDTAINGNNFKKYCNTHGYSKLDIVLIALGGNDVGHGNTSFDDDKADTIIANAKLFIDTLLSETYGYPNCKVIVGIPILGAKDSYSEIFYNRNLTMLSWKYIELFDNGAYNPNVTCVNQRLFLDRVEAFPYEERPNPFNAEVKNKIFTDVYHPSRVYNGIPYGYYQLGVAFYSKIRSVLNGIL